MQLKVVRFVSRCACGFAAAIGILFSGLSAQAQSVWNNSGTNWTTGTNWTGGVPGNSGIAQFNASSYAYNPNVGSATQVGEIWDNGSGSFTIGGAATLTMSGSASGPGGEIGLLMDSTGTLTVATQIASAGIDGSGNSAGYVLVHQGTVNVNSAGSITNLGQLDLGDVSGQTGTLMLSGGTVTLPQIGNTGNWTGVSVGLNGGTGVLNLTGNSLFDASGYGGLEGIMEIGWNGSTGSVTVGGNSVLRSGYGQMPYYQASISGSWLTVGEGGNGTLTITGSGLVSTDLLYVGSRENGGSPGGNGTIHLDGGTLAVNGIFHDSTTTGTVYFNGGMLLNSYPGYYNYVNSSGNNGFYAYVQAGGAVINTGGTMYFETPLLHDPALGATPDGGLTKLGSGLLWLYNSGNTYTGPTTVSGGALELNSPPGAVSGSVSAGASLIIGSGTSGWNSSQIGSLLNPSNFTWGANTTLGFDTTNGDFTYGGNIAQPTSLTKLGNNSLSLSGTNTYTGPTTVTAGALGVASTASLPGYNTGAVSVASGAGLAVRPFNGTSGWTAAQITSLLNNVAWSPGSGSFAVGVPAAFGIDTSGGNATYNGSVVTTSGNSVALSMPSGMPLAKAGANALTIVGNNTYNGGTTLYSGQLNIGSPGALGTGTLSINGGAIDNTSGSDMTLTGSITQVWNSNFTYVGATNSLNLGAGIIYTPTEIVTVTVAANTLNVGGTIMGWFWNNPAQGGYTSIHKAGAGTLVLSGSVNMSGAGDFYADQGVLTLSGTCNLSSGSDVWVAPGAQLNINNVYALGTGPGSGSLVIYGGGIVDNTSGADVAVSNLRWQNWDGNFTYVGATNNLTLAGQYAVSLGANCNVTVAAHTFTEGSGITGNYSLTKSGSGTLVLGGADSYTGGTTINGGALTFNTSGALPASGNVTINSGGALTATGPYTTINGWLGSGRIVGASAGVLAVPDGVNDSTTVNNMSGYPNLYIGATGNATFSGSFTPAVAGVYQLGGGGGALAFTTALTGGNTLNAFGGGSGGTLILTGINTYTGATAIGSGGTLEFGNAANQTLSGSISGAGALATIGPGMLILTGSNSYSGGTTIGGGTLQMGSALALGSTNGSLAVNGGALDLNGKSATVGALSGGGTVDNRGGGFCTLSVGANDASGGFGGVIQNTTGTVALTKIGAGVLDLSGTSAYSGPTKISAGTVELDGNGENLPQATALTIASGGVLDLAGVPQTVGSLSGSAGAIITSRYSGNPTLTVAVSSGSTTFAGNIISNNALALSGSGQLTLSGTNNYTGGTTVSGGTLDIAAPSALAGSGLVTIAAGGRLVLGSGAGIGALLAVSSPASSDAVALSAAAVPATLGGPESGYEDMATLGGAPPLSQGGGGSAVGGTAAAVPEPAALALLAAGAAAAAAVLRRKRKGC